MTEPPPTEEAAEAATPEASSSLNPAPPVLGLTTFTIANRRAPAIFVVGWISALVGGGLVVTGGLGGDGAGAQIFTVLGLAGLGLGLLLLAGAQAIERRAAGLVYSGPSPVLVFAAVVATLPLAGFLIGTPLVALGIELPVGLGDLLAVVVQGVVFLGVVRLTVVGQGALSWSEMGLTRGAEDAVRGLFGGAVYALPVILVTGVLAALAVQVAGVTPPSPLPPTGTTEGLVLHLLAGAVIAPAYEEIVFRGFALTAWRRTVGPWAAIARSSALFVLAHALFVGGDSFAEAASLAVVAGVVRIPIAIALGWLFVRSGSIWAPIGLHAAFNGILIVIAESAAAA